MNDSFLVTGGGPLNGEVTLSGTKNAASKMMIASLLTSDPVRLSNVPRQRETEITQEIITKVGANVTWEDDHTIVAHTPDISTTSVRKLTRKNRISILALAPLLHRTGEAFVPKPDGDRIGPRPVNFHIEALQKMGAHIEETDEGFQATTPNGLSGALIELPYPSVGATETSILAGVLAKGRTTIRNAATEPEIIGLIMMLQNMGAIIQINTGRHIEIIGVERLHGVDARVMPDRLEAASYACIALGTGGEIFVRGAEHRPMITFLNAVRKVGGTYEVSPEGILFKGKGKLTKL